MNIREQYKLAFRYHRLMHEYVIAAGFNDYPVGFDCKEKEECGDESWDYRCPCWEEAETRIANAGYIEAWALNCKRDTTPELIETTRDQWAFAEEVFDGWGKRRKPKTGMIKHWQQLRGFGRYGQIKPGFSPDLIKQYRNLRMLGIHGYQPSKKHASEE